MKKPLLLSLAFLAFFLPANAQLSFGIKGSFTKASYNTDHNDAPKMDGLGISVALYKRVNKFLEIGTEPGISQRGTTQTFGQAYDYNYICCFGDCLLPYFPEGQAQAMKATYIQAPIMARASLPLANGKLALFGKLGGGPSWFASGYYDTEVYDEITFEGRPENKALDFSESDSPRRWDVGLYSGAGLGCKLGCGMLTLETEYYHGLRDVVNYASFKNRSFGYSLGYFINL